MGRRNELKTYNFERGFTLVELLTVIAIIGILASVAFLYYNDARSRGRDSKRISDIKQIQLALELYYDANTAFPATLAGLQPTFLGLIPTPPAGAGQSAYAYAARGSGASCTGYHLGAVLEQTSNKNLSDDNDAESGGVCAGSAADFHGNAANCSGGSAASPDPCYDVAP